jgi:hypothetical protein
MDLPQEIKLLLMILAAFLIGIVVLIVNPEYRIEQIRKSNTRYYADSFSETVDQKVDTEEQQSQIEF